MTRTAFPLKALARWFQNNQRDLPWRKNQDPYRVWISEIMLQQTQVDTVIPYYLRFLKKFPTIQALAKAEEQDVLSLWTGLGYYSRARNLHKSAVRVVEKWNGKFPDTYKDLLDLPGIGPYTAGAVSSIAYDQPEPIYDGNVRRVLSRIYLSRDDQSLHKISGTLVKDAHNIGIKPSVFNQALMELGALLCGPRNPDCSACPVNHACLARKKNVQDLYPIKIKSSKIVQQFYAVGLLSLGNKTDRLMVTPRSQSTRWLKGLWEFPTVELLQNPSETTIKTLSKIFSQRYELPVILHKNIGEFKHSITNHQLRVSVFTGKASTLPPGAKWVKQRDLSTLSASSMLSKSLALLGRIL